MRNITEKLGAASFENNDFEKIVKRIEDICNQEDLYKKQTEDIPHDIKKYGIKKAVKVVLDDFDNNWLNSLTLYIYDGLNCDANFGGFFCDSLSDFQNKKENAVLVLRMKYPDLEYAEEVYKLSFFNKNNKKQSFTKFGTTPKSAYQTYIKYYEKTTFRTFSHELRHAYDHWSDYFSSSIFDNDMSYLDSQKLDSIERSIANSLRSNSEEMLKCDKEWVYPSQDIQDIIKQYKIATVKQTGCTIKFFQANMYYMKNKEINAYLESIVGELKYIYIKYPYLFSDIDYIKKHVSEINYTLKKYLFLYKELKNFVNEATKEDYTKIMSQNDKSMAALTIKFKYPKLSIKNQKEKYYRLLDEEIQKGTLKDYLEYKIECIGKMIKRALSIIYIFCQKFRKEKYYTFIYIRYIESEDIKSKEKEIVLIGNPIQLAETFYVLNKWFHSYVDYDECQCCITDFVNSSSSYAWMIEHNEMEEMTRTVYKNIIKHINSTALWSKKDEIIENRLKNIKASEENIFNLIEQYLKHMKVEFETFNV